MMLRRWVVPAGILVFLALAILVVVAFDWRQILLIVIISSPIWITLLVSILRKREEPWERWDREGCGKPGAID